MNKLEFFSRFKIVYNDEAYYYFKDVYEVLKKIFHIDSMILFDMDHSKCLSYGIKKDDFEIEQWMEKYINTYVSSKEIFYSLNCSKDKECKELNQRLDADTSIFIPLKAILKIEPGIGNRKIFTEVHDLININFNSKNAISEEKIVLMGLLLNQYLIRFQAIKELKSYVNISSAIYEETPFGLMVVDEKLLANVNSSGRKLLDMPAKSSMVCSRMGLCFYCNKKDCEHRNEYLIDIKKYLSKKQLKIMQGALKKAFKNFESQVVQFWYNKKYIRFNIVPFVLMEESLQKFYDDKKRKSLISALISFQNISDTLEKEKLKRDLDIAKRIQMKLLPKRHYPIENIDIKAAYLAAREVGGDYYDLLKFKNKNKLGVIIGDISGKGLPSALIVSELKGFLNSTFSKNENLMDIVLSINNYLRTTKERSLFVTAIIGILDIKKKKFKWIRCGHNEPIYYNSSMDEVKYVKSRGIGLNLSGGNDFKKSLEIRTIDFDKGDLFFMYTDGVVERMNESNEEYGEKRLLNNIYKSKKRNSTQIVKNSLKNLQKFAKETPRDDDMTLLSIKIN